MENGTRYQYTDLTIRLIKDGKQFEFFQLLRLLFKIPDQSLKFQSARLRQFPTSDIQNIIHDNHSLTVCLSFMGLYGVDSPLPHYITDLTVKNNQLAETFRNFLDIFNQRFYELLFEMWKKYHSYVEIEGKDAKYLQYLKSISGNVSPELDYIELTYAGLLGARIKNAENLRSILKDFLNEKVEIIAFVPYWNQLNDVKRLGIKLYLRGNSIVGMRTLNISTMIHIIVGPTDYNVAKTLLPDQPKHRQLNQLIKQFLGPMIHFNVELVVIRCQTDKLYLGKDKIYLGWLTWLGTFNDQSLSKFVIVRG